MNDASRKVATRFYEKMHKMPSTHQAADYSAASTYLKAVAAVKTTDSDKVMAQLKKMKINDFYSHGYIRQDGRYIHNMYLMQVKTPAESKEPWRSEESSEGKVCVSKCRTRGSTYHEKKK